MIRATVRLQLHAGFTLDAAGAQLDYYDALGISHLYLSPVARARCGSTHGYDVIDHAQVNPELGGLAALRRLAGAARARGMGLILDIVPNHMAAHPDNRWWREVLRDGPASAYADWFDIDWRPPGRTLRGRVLLPVLTCGARAALASGEIGLRAGSDGTPALHANGLDLPLAPASLPMAALLLHHGGTPAQWHALLRAQAYRLAWWRSAAQTINWRRFFEIGDLVGVRVERPEVFDAVHALPLALYRAGLIDGLRIDHVDGLAEPGAYCRRLRAELAQAGQARAARGLSAEPYVVVEKILGDKETLRTDWPVQGTTGYDFMNEASAWLHDARGAAPLAAFWRDNAGTWPHWREQLRRIRLRLLRRHFGAERRALARSLADLPELRASAAAIDPVLTQWLACFPVYRTYAEGGAGQAADQAWRQTAQTRANAHLDPAQQALLAALCLALDGRMADAPHRLALRRLQQLTPPLAAKALEDTWFYRDGTLLSRNEVGPAPAQFALGGGALRRSVAARARRHPQALLATASHDHKRGEDVRARLAVLSEMPQQWCDWARQWLADAGGSAAPPAWADRYMLLQTLVGAWPADLAPDDQAGMAALLRRVAAWQAKALREARQRSSWTCPDLAYETLCARYLRALADDGAALPAVAALARRLAPAGLVNSLAQTALRLGLPGVPDLYQGCETWDLSLVDPDNRRAVDYAARRGALASLGNGALALPELWRDGRAKQALVARALQWRREQPALFEHGACRWLRVSGARARHVLACLRTRGPQQALIVVPRASALALAGQTGPDRDAAAHWRDTCVHLPADAPPWRDILTHAGHQGRALALSELLARWPVALCRVQS